MGQALFSIGGRPVIYQPEAEYSALPETLRWRHVRYDLGVVPPIDFTWEREWRVRSDELCFDENFASVFLPNEEWRERFIDDMDQESYDYAYSWTIALGDEAWYYYTGNTWDTVTPN